MSAASALAAPPVEAAAADERQLTLTLATVGGPAESGAVEPPTLPQLAVDAVTELAVLRSGEDRHQDGCQCHRCIELRRVLLTAGAWQRLYSSPAAAVR